MAALVIWPKVALPKPPSGLGYCGVLVKLKLSTRNSNLMRSVTAKRRKMERSTLAKPGPLKALWPTLPKVLAAGTAKTPYGPKIGSA